MSFTRYEIRWYYRRCFYEGGDTMEYMPFDTRKEAEKYADEHKEECKSYGGCDCGIYKVKLYSDYDCPTLVKQL